MSYIPYIDPTHYGNFFQIDDVSTPIDPAAEHFVISGYGTYGAPERDVTPVSIPGRNGDLIFDNGRFTNAEVFYDIGWARGFGGDFSYDIGNTDLQDWDRGSAFPGDVGITCTVNRSTGTVSVSGTLANVSSTVFEMYISLTRGRYKFAPNASGTMSAYYYGVLLDENLYDTSTMVMTFPLSSGFSEMFIDIPQDGQYRFWLQLRGQGNTFSNTLQPRIYSVGVTQNPYTGFDYFRGRLMSKADTYYKLTDSYHPGEYRMARVARIEEISTTALNDGGRCRVVFACKPQRFLESGEESTALTNNTAKSIALNTYYPSNPVITVTPTSTAVITKITVANTVTISGTSTTMSASFQWSSVSSFAANTPITIDCGLKKATYNDIPAEITQTTTDFPYLIPPGTGTNSVKVTVTLSSGTVTIGLHTKEYVV